MGSTLLTIIKRKQRNSYVHCWAGHITRDTLWIVTRSRHQDRSMGGAAPTFMSLRAYASWNIGLCRLPHRPNKLHRPPRPRQRRAQIHTILPARRTPTWTREVAKGKGTLLSPFRCVREKGLISLRFTLEMPSVLIASFGSASGSAMCREPFSCHGISGMTGWSGNGIEP